MNIIYCTSYLQVPVSITLAEKSGGDFVIFFQQQRLYDFFSTIYDSKFLFMFPPTKFYALNHKFKLISNFFETLSDKKRIKKKLKHYHNANIYYFGYAYSEFETWSVKFLSKNNNVFYSQSVTIFSDAKILNSLYSWIIRLPYLLLFGIKFDVIYNGKTTFTVIPHDFRQQINAKPVNIESDDFFASKIVAEKLNITQKELLYLTGAVVEEGFIDNNEFVSKNDKMLEFLETRYGKDLISLKMHPRFLILRSKEFEFEQIEKNVPANLILNNFKLLIAYDSTVLFEAANKDILSISLLNYFVPTSDKTKKHFVKYINENLKPGKKVYFPETIDQLKTILDDVKPIYS